MADDSAVQPAQKRRRWMWVPLLAGLVAAGIILTLARRQPARRAAGGPIGVTPGAFRGFNLLLVSIDTLRADRVGCYGYAHAETPTLDGLARRGVRCAQAITPVPLTLPAHASLLSGLNPQHHGARANVVFAIPDRVQTLAEILRDHGYHTGAVVSAFVLDRRFGLAQGFEQYADDLSGDGRLLSSGYLERVAEKTNRPALTWVEDHGQERFFLWVHYFDPHIPYAPPGPFADRHKGRPYDGEIAYADAELGRLLATIDRMGIRERTLIVVAGDHGEAFGEHEEFTHGLLIYDTTLLVPLIFSGPPPLPQGAVLACHVGLIDVVPTVLEMLGLPVPAGLDGVSLLKPTAAGPRALYVESLWPKVMHNWSPLAGLRREDVKYIVAPEPELYDLRADPKEVNNVLRERRELAAALHDELRGQAGSDPEMLAAVSGNLPLDDETRRKMAGLGYLVAGSATTTTASLPDPKDMMGQWSQVQRAFELKEAGRYTEAIALLEPIVHQAAQDTHALGVLAECYVKVGRLDEAGQLYARQLTLTMRKAQALADLGHVRIRQDKLAEAETLLRKALDDEPQNPTALFGLGVIASRRGQRSEAIAMFRKCIAEGGRDQAAPCYYNIGLLNEQAGSKAEARASYEKALAIDPHDVPSAQALARTLQAENRPDDAIRTLRQALGDRVAPEARMHLGGLLVTRNRLPEAVDQFRAVLEHNPRHAGAHFELGSCLQRLNRTKEAVEHLNRCLELDARHVEARLLLGGTYAKRGNLDEARSQFDQAVNLAPDRLLAHYSLGTVLIKQGRLDLAEQAFAEAVRLAPQNPAAHNALGQVLLRLGRRDDAIAQFRESLRIAPNFKPARENLRRAGTQPAQ